MTRIALAVALVLAAPAALAATATDPMTNTINLQNACTVAANDLNFGNQTTLAANIDATTTVVVNCTMAGAYNVRFNAGTGTGATFASRRMSFGTNIVNYSLYADTARTQVLGDNSTGTTQLTGVGTGANQTFNVFGRVFSGQGAKPPGTYSDTVTATITF